MKSENTETMKYENETFEQKFTKRFSGNVKVTG